MKNKLSPCSTSDDCCLTLSVALNHSDVEALFLTEGRGQLEYRSYYSKKKVIRGLNRLDPGR